MSAPDLEVLSNDAPATPSNWNFEDDDELLDFSVDHVLEKTLGGLDEEWMNEARARKNSFENPERRRSSGVAIQQLLSQLDSSSNSFDDANNLSAATFMESSFNASPTWKVVVETAFSSKYFRNDRKNIQCFPVCTLGAPKNAADAALGHGKSTTWCRGAVNARAFAIDPETNIADISMFEAFGTFAMHSENPKTKPLPAVAERIRGSIRKVDGRSFEIKIAPTVWKFEPPLSKKKSEENRNQCFFVVFICFRGREVGRCVSPPFDLASQKAEIRKKRALANEESSWGPKHLVLDTFAQASNWAFQTMGMRSPKPDEHKVMEKEDEAKEDDPESVETLESSLQLNAGKMMLNLGVPKQNLEATTEKTSNVSAQSMPRYPQLHSSSTAASDAHGSSKLSTTSQDSARFQAPLYPPPGLDLGFFHHQNQIGDPIVTASVVAPPQQIQSKRVSLALLLWLPPFGFLGAHHAYLGRGTYALISALTLNLFLLGWIADALRLPMLVYAANFPSAAKMNMQFLTFMEFFFLWLLFGLFGGHRYALGDWKSGLFYTITLGGLGTLWIWDGFHLSELLASNTKLTGAARIA